MKEKVNNLHLTLNRKLLENRPPFWSSAETALACGLECYTQRAQSPRSWGRWRLAKSVVSSHHNLSFLFAAHRSSSLGLRFVTCRPLHLRLKKQEDHAVMAHQLTPMRIFFQVAGKFNARGDFPVAVFRVLFKKGCGIVLLWMCIFFF